jgi:hypothetical protein
MGAENKKDAGFWLLGCEFVGLMYRKTTPPLEDEEIHYHVIAYDQYESIAKENAILLARIKALEEINAEQSRLIRAYTE